MAQLPSYVARSLSIDNIKLFNLFYKLVINERQKVSRVAENYSDRDQSSITKTILTLSDGVAFETKGTPLFTKTGTQWNSTYLCDELFSITKEIELDFKSIGELIDNKARSTLRILINSYSYHIFKSIEEKMFEIDPHLEFYKDFSLHRSSKIIEELIKNRDVDVGISETIDEIVDTQYYESIKIDSNELVVLTNFKLNDKHLVNGKITRDGLKAIPLVSGDTRSIMDFLIYVHHSFEPDLAKQTISTTSLEDKVSFINDHYRITETSTAVSLLLDMLIFDRNNIAMLATPEVARSAFALQKDKDYANGFINQRRKITKYYIHDNDIRINKFALKKKKKYRSKQEENTNSQKYVERIFWQASQMLAEEN